MTRTRLCLYLILFTPFLIYWQTASGDYGLRDDYSNMREAREETSKLVKFTASHGRPIYGALLETSLSRMTSISELRLMRLGTVGLLTLLALALWRQLYRAGWTEFEAAAIGLGVVLLPAAQVVASWAICWPHVLALLLAVAGFSAIEAELEHGGLKRAVALLGGFMIYLLAGLIYQSNALFAVVPIAATLLVRTGHQPLRDLRWLVIHLVTLFGALFAGYLLVKFLYSTGIFERSPRMAFEGDPVGKLVWFFAQPLPDALSLYALRDDHNIGVAVFAVSALVVGALIVLGGRLVPNPEMRKRWILCVAVLPFAAHAVSFAAAERAIGYRVLFALSGLVLVLLVFAIRMLRDSKRVHLKVSYLALGTLVTIAAVSAHVNAEHLLARPQGREWKLIRSAVQQHTFKGETRVYIVTPTLADRSTERVYADEFGSLSSDSDWAPREMFKAAVYERFGDNLPKGASYSVVLGRAEPVKNAYSLVVDMRQLREFRPR